MCWCGINKPLVVKKNEHINVVKIVLMTDDRKYVPYFVKNGKIKEYKPGGIYNEIIEDEIGYLIEIRQGIHSYLAKNVRIIPTTADCMPYNQSINYDEYRVAVEHGLATLWTYRYDRNNVDENLHKHLCLLMGHLPEGTTYYANSCGEIVSDALEVDLIRPFYLGVRYE